ncbi:hypothetical protein [Nocardia sp. NPDC058497]|uniref:hypothetical protein n=1 Tax=Nocardia sp. NPDC058497 TaxID=3346529 RepID=UPI00364A0BF5
MSNTTIQVAAISLTASIAGVIALVAAADSGFDVRAEQWVRRIRMSADERAEFDALEEQIEQRRQAREAFLDARTAEARAKFRTELVSTVSGRYVHELAEFTVAELVEEIVAVKQRLNTERKAMSYSDTPEATEHRAAIDARDGQLAALTAEFDFRNDWQRRKDLGRLDGQRLRAASDMVRDGSEWPSAVNPYV